MFKITLPQPKKDKINFTSKTGNEFSVKGIKLTCYFIANFLPISLCIDIEYFVVVTRQLSLCRWWDDWSLFLVWHKKVATDVLNCWKFVLHFSGAFIRSHLGHYKLNFPIRWVGVHPMMKLTRNFSNNRKASQEGVYCIVYICTFIYRVHHTCIVEPTSHGTGTSKCVVSHPEWLVPTEFLFKTVRGHTVRPIYSWYTVNTQFQWSAGGMRFDISFFQTS